MTEKKALVACLGNVFLGDDGFGPAVAGALAASGPPPGAAVVDFGIRGRDLAFTLLDEWRAVIIVDAVRRGGAPGTLYVIEPDARELAAAPAPGAAFDSHSVDPVSVLRSAQMMGARLENLLVVGCEPESFGGAEGRMELSGPVAAAVPQAARLVASLLAKNADESRDDR